MAKAKWPWAAVQAYRRQKDCIEHLISERDYWYGMYAQCHKARWWVRARWALVGAAFMWVALRCV